MLNPKLVKSSYIVASTCPINKNEGDLNLVSRRVMSHSYSARTAVLSAI